MNPAIGIHNIGTPDAASYTSASGYNSNASGSTFLVVITQLSGGNNPPASVTDKVNGSATGNSYTAPIISGTGNPGHDTGNGGYIWVYLCTNGIGGTNHEISVSAFSGGTLGTVDFIEITGASTSSPIDVSNSAYSAVPVNIAVTPSGSGDLIIGIAFAGAAGSTITANTGGYTTLEQSSGGTVSYGSAYLAGATSSSQDPSMTTSGGSLAAFTLAFAPGVTAASIAWLT